MELEKGTTKRWLDQAWRALRIASYLLLGLHAAIVIVVVAIRIGYPHQLEWMEGGMVDHVRRVMDGQPLYVPPTLEFVPFLYPPLFYGISAVAASVIGPTFLTLRLVSVLSALCCAWLVYRLASSEGGREAGWLGCGLFIATFFAGGSWFDLARVDMLFLALLLSVFAVVQNRQTAARYAVAGILLGLAFLTKQTALVAAFPFCVYILWRDRMKALPLPIAAALIAGSVLAVLSSTSDGWSTFYLFAMPGDHAWSITTIVSFWTEDLLGVLGIAIVIAVASLIGLPPGKRNWWIAILLGVGGSAYLSRLHIGGWINVLIPVYAVGSALCGVGVVWLRKKAGSLRQAAVPKALALLYGALCVQFAGLVVNPTDHIPSQADRDSGARLEAFLAAQPVPAYAPSYGYLAERAGHPPGAHMMAMWDVLRTNLDEREFLQNDMAAALAEQRFSVLMFPASSNYGLSMGTALEDSLYVLVDPDEEPALQGLDDFRPVAGFPGRPGPVYRRVLE